MKCLIEWKGGKLEWVRYFDHFLLTERQVACAYGALATRKQVELKAANGKGFPWTEEDKKQREQETQDDMRPESQNAQMPSPYPNLWRKARNDGSLR